MLLTRSVVSVMANWLKNIRGVLLDISGTLHIGENPTRDAAQALKRCDID